MKLAHAIILVVVLSLSAFAPAARADMMTFTGAALTEWVKVKCDGLLADGMTVQAGSYGVVYQDRGFDAFCVDADHYAGSAYVSEVSIDTLSNSMQVAYLYETFVGSATDSETAAALGVALWEVLYETDDEFDVSTGEFRICRNDDVAAAANVMLTGMPDEYVPAMDLTVLHSRCRQDMLIGGLHAIPEPTTMALVLTGAGLMLARRRQAA